VSDSNNNSIDRCSLLDVPRNDFLDSISKKNTQQLVVGRKASTESEENLDYIVKEMVGKMMADSQARLT
jgi:hypothetical protein